MNIYNIVFTDYTGSSMDLTLLQQANWLQTAKVSYALYERKNLWHIRLCFIDANNAYRIICRYINDSYYTKQKAEVYAANFLRAALKGNYNTKNTSSININYN